MPLTLARLALPTPSQRREIQLNETTVRSFFLAGNSYVYVIDGLPTPTDDPCSRKVRWRSLGPGCAGGVTPLDNATKAVLAEAINASSDPNPIVKDVELSRDARQQCTKVGADGTTAVGSVVEVNGVCWQHTHDEELNVYDFTLWSQSHPGNINSAGFWPIKRVAQYGGAILPFPSFHSINNWNKGYQVGETFGRLGDWITFDSLPQSVQTAGFAEAVDVAVAAKSGVPTFEMCGSAGEVAADPFVGNHLYFGKERYSQVASYSQQVQQVE